MRRDNAHQEPETIRLIRSEEPVIRPAMLRLTVQIPGSPGIRMQRLKHPRQVMNMAARGGLGNDEGRAAPVALETSPSFLRGGRPRARQSWPTGSLSDIMRYSFPRPAHTFIWVSYRVGP